MNEDRPLLNARANKSLGQHFLYDPDILNRMALAAGAVQDRVVVEVGPGAWRINRRTIETWRKSRDRH